MGRRKRDTARLLTPQEHPGWSEKERRFPPTRTLAPMPTPSEASALMPRYSPARAPDGTPEVVADTTPQTSCPASVAPSSIPHSCIVPS